jgi:predicted alpha/beta superfamily hydrolase
MHPFIALNAALAPNRQGILGSRFSLGGGLTLRTDYITVECYYNLYMKGERNELRNGV